MCESILEWIKFWLGCIHDGFEAEDYLFGISEFLLVIVIGFLTYRKRHHHAEKWEERSVKWVWRILGVSFVVSTIFVAPFVKYSDADAARKTAQSALGDKSPKLEGFIDQWMTFVRPGETNETIIPQIHINNFGGSGSLAESFKLKFILATNDLVEAKPIDIPDYYQWQSMKGDQITVFRLFRQELISEKAATAIEPGFGPRGWLAFTMPRILSQKQLTNHHFVISFLDAAGNENCVTNGFWKGQLLTNGEPFDIPRTLAGSVNLVYTNYQLQSDVANGWRPPELPPDCTNVVVFLGADPMAYSRFMAEISPDEGTKFAIKDIPDFFLTGLENSPGYDPSQPDMWLKYSTMLGIGGKTIPYPVQPIIISNRLYVEVEIPFSNEKHKLVMSDSFDSQLHKPRNWDRNYSTNYYVNGGIYAYEVVNELKNPVLQVNYAAPNVVFVNGIFQVDSNSILVAFGEHPQLLTFKINDQDQTQGIMTASLQADTFHETLIIQSNETIASFGQRLTNEFFRPIFKYQRPIFKYPSNRKLGVFEEWKPETNNNKSVTNIVDKPQ
jgi:hypothetical protein